MENNIVTLDMGYGFKGSQNYSLVLKENGDDIDIISSYGERISSVRSGYGLMRVLEDLNNDSLA